MVSKQSYKAFKDIDGGPPPLDESWWEAVLAEEEGHKPAGSSRLPPSAAQR
jgi:hypothetical protein